MSHTEVLAVQDRGDTLKTLRFYYDLKIRFSAPVTRHSFTVKCMVRPDERQQILRQDVRILPKEFLSENRDSFGNAYIFGRTDGEHDLFQVTVEGEVRTGLADSTRAEELYRQGMYLAQTSYTRPGPALRRLFEEMGGRGDGDALTVSLRFMKGLRERFAYQSGSTCISTTAEEALEQGSGVCQDYSHILLSLCRLAGIPCRYVVGMLIGEGASHAWVEALHQGRWYGLDPTNDLRVDEDHIKISHGRDYSDCLINQGVFTGSASQTQSIAVRVSASDGCAGGAET